MYRESKSELTDRLRREGRFDDFKARREALKLQGMPAGDAWRVAADEFPPLAPVAPPDRPVQMTETLSDTDMAALHGKRPVPVLEVVRWVFEAMDQTSIRPADAPSAGAWSMLRWVRENPRNRAEFYTGFVPKLLSARPATDDERPTDDKGENEEDAKMLADMLGWTV